MKIICKCMKNETIRYLFWGIVTVCFSYLVYWILQFFVLYQIANLISIVTTKIFAYYTNKKFVFRTKTNVKEQFFEIIRYACSRGGAGVIDFIGLIVLTEIFQINSNLGKAIMIVVTTVINYVLGKFVVFRNGNGVLRN